MKKLLLATAAGALLAGAASAEDVKLGISLGFTGPLESMAPGMASGAELAMKEVTDSGLLLDGSTVTAVQGDSTCIDAAAATATAPPATPCGSPATTSPMRRCSRSCLTSTVSHSPSAVTRSASTDISKARAMCARSSRGRGAASPW